MEFGEFFIRPKRLKKFDKAYYHKQKIFPRLNGNTLKLANLFEDCFSSHTAISAISPEYFSKCVSIAPAGTSRIVNRDPLSIYFVKNIYQPHTLHWADQPEVKVNYKDLKEDLWASSYIPEAREGRLGSNKVRIVEGKTGIGKTLLARRLELDTLEEFLREFPNRAVIDYRRRGYSIPLPVYIDVFHIFSKGDTLRFEPEDIDMEKLKEEIIERTFDLLRMGDGRLRFRGGFLEVEIIKSKAKEESWNLKDLCTFLKENKVHLLLIFDEMDEYQFFYTRYAFFDEFLKRMHDKIFANVTQLIRNFTEESRWGCLGINAIFFMRNDLSTLVCRQFQRRNLNTGDPTLTVLEMEEPEIRVIFFSRYRLLTSVLDDRDVRNAIHSLGFRHNQLLLNALHGIWMKPSKVHLLIKEIAHHGYRSLIKFYSELKIPLDSRDLLIRYVQNPPYSFLIVYINNLYRKYTQAQGHFPNMFLNDAVVLKNEFRRKGVPESLKASFEEAHKPHLHTYWLKYLVLKYIVKMDKKEDGERVFLRDLIKVFCEKGKYEEHLLRHVVGSLSTPNESWCLECEISEEESADSVELKPTNRGKTLVSKYGELDKELREELRNVEFCFSLEYLETIIDDYLLSLPRKWATKIYLTDFEGYVHLASLRDKDFREKAEDTIEKKSKAVLYFLRVLEASFKEEVMKFRKELYEYLKEKFGEEFFPKFDDIANSIVSSATNILNSLTNTQNEPFQGSLEELWRKLKEDKEFEKFFEEYYRKGILVE